MDILETQKNVLEFIKNSKSQNRLAHAYMFLGPKGVGKLETALYFACMLWCKDEVPCLSCSSCKQILNKQFLNLIHVKSSTSRISVSDVENLQKEFDSTASLDGPRIYIIEDADKMDIRTQNKLLKFIEEPTSSMTYGILLTSNSDLIISTIKSRVISLTLNELSYDFIISKLKDNNVNNKYLYLLPYIENSVEKCVDLLEDPDKVKIIDLVYEFIDKLSNRNITLFYKKNSEFLSKVNLVIFINLLEEFFKDLYKVILGNDPVTFVDTNFDNFRLMYKLSYISEIIDELVEFEHKLRYNSNINLNFVKLISMLNGGVIR